MYSQHIFCLGLIAFYSFNRYNTPHTNRFSTVFSSFAFFYFLYFIFNVCTYFLIVIILEEFRDPLIKVFGQSSEWNLIKDLEPGIAATLMLTTLFPNFPYLKRIDQSILNYVWDLGRIPGYMIKQARDLRNTAIEYGPKLRTYIRNKAEEYGIDVNKICFLNDKGIYHEWTRVSAMMCHLEDWERGHKKQQYKRFLSDTQNQIISKEYGDARLLYKSVSQKLKEIDDLQIKDSVSEELKSNYEKELLKDLTDLHKSTSELIARGVSSCELSSKGRHKAYRLMSFSDGAYCKNFFTLSQIISLVSIVFVVYLLISFIDASIKSQNLFSFSGAIFTQTFLMCLTYNFAVYAALYPRDKYGITSPDYTSREMSYIIAGLISVFLGFVAMLFVRSVEFYFLNKDIISRNFLDTIVRNSPFLINNFAIATGLSWIVSRNDVREKFFKKDKYLDAGRLTLIMFLVSIPMIFLILKLKDPQYRTIYLNNYSHIVEAIKSIAIGAIIGYFTPYWYKKNRRNSPENTFSNYLNMNHNNITLDTRGMDNGSLEKAFASAAILISNADGQVDTSEIKVSNDMFGKFKCANILDFDQIRARNELEDRAATVNNLDEALLLEDLEPIKGKSHLTKTMRLFIDTVVSADNEVTDDERAMKMKIIEKLGAPR